MTQDDPRLVGDGHGMTRWYDIVDSEEALFRFYMKCRRHCSDWDTFIAREGALYLRRRSGFVDADSKYFSD